jgi:type I restriction-modification system DNA methylase subunit
MNLLQIQEKVENITKNTSKDSFIFDLLLAYNTPKATIARLQKGTSNVAKGDREVLLKGKLFFKEIYENDLHISIDNFMHDPQVLRYGPRFIIVTDFNTFLSVDTKTKDTLDITFKELHKNFVFFLPWAGLEKIQSRSENPVDIKAAYKMARLYDVIRHDNPELGNDKIHELNVFLSRLLFCFFAEDTEIFTTKLFSDSISNFTKEDGSDLCEYLDILFDELDSKDNSSFPIYIQKFPYVNGGLFGVKIKSPIFSSRSRKMIIDCGTDLDWSQINPDIFGSMMQAVVHSEQRHESGMHYTSVVNIMKVIEPLFLLDLKEEFHNSIEDKKGLEKLLKRLSNIKIFDPACGSGNFLIISYKEIRKLEIEIFKRLRELNPQRDLEFSNVSVSQFYGIEIDDFAHEIAILSLWLTEHQMNIAFKNEFGQTRPTLPLKEAGNIICENAIKVDWKKVCPVDGNEVYVLGNPPYLGSSVQSEAQKIDLASVCNNFDNYKNLDYISCWFIKGSDYILNRNSKLAFVSTNSICQGQQVALLWPNILNKSLEIFFAHQSFKWVNSAKNNAGVSCVVIGLRNIENSIKRIYKDNAFKIVKNINGYLTSNHNIYIENRSKSISNLPEMVWGNKAVDGGHLIIEKNEIDKVRTQLEKYPYVIKKFTGSDEFINNIQRWCLWIEETDVEKLLRIKEIRERINKVQIFRADSKKEATRNNAAMPFKFAEIRYKKKPSIIIPSVTSERREYIPIGFLDREYVISNSAHVIYDPEPWVFGIISSKMHMTWVRNVAGRLKTDYRYSSAICYNTFPIPDLTTKQKQIISNHVFNVLGEREKHPEKTIANLYDPDKMPLGLRTAHKGLDESIDHCYRSKIFETEEERLEYLFKLYDVMTKKENNDKFN